MQAGLILKEGKEPSHRTAGGWVARGLLYSLADPRGSEGLLTTTSSLGVPGVPSPGEEESGTPTPQAGLEDWIITRAVPGVAVIPLREETTAVLDFTTGPENQTEWEPVYTTMGLSPLPG